MVLLASIQLQHCIKYRILAILVSPLTVGGAWYRVRYLPTCRLSLARPGVHWAYIHTTRRVPVLSCSISHVPRVAGALVVFLDLRGRLPYTSAHGQVSAIRLLTPRGITARQLHNWATWYIGSCSSRQSTVSV